MENWLSSSIARQCFVFGGPSVFLARSMYSAATGIVDNSFQDYCLENFGSYKTEQATIRKTTSINVYPNPTETQYGFYVTSNVNATGVVSNSIGQTVKTVVIGQGFNHLQTPDLQAGIYQITWFTEEGEVITHRLIVK